jgi:hypothetical protein
VFGSLIFQADPLSVPPWKYGGYAGLSVPTERVPSVTKVAPAAHCSAVCAALPLAAGIDVVVSLAHAAVTDARTANTMSDFRIVIPSVTGRRSLARAC